MMWPWSRNRAIQTESREEDATNVHVTLAQLRAALNAMPMGVVLADPHGTEWWRNRTAYDFFGSDDGELHGVVESVMGDAIRGRASTRIVEREKLPVRTFQLRGLPTFDGGGLVVIEDQTERSLTDRVRTDFVANISHELKTPIGALSVLAETIAAETEGSESDIVRLSKRLVSEAERMATIVDDLLELSRIEFGGEALSSPVDLRDIAREAVGRLYGSADNKAIKISFVDAQSSVTVAGDRRQLVSAVANLLDNAVKYSDSGSIVEVMVESNNGLGSLCVIDHGIGIPAEDITRIFERFYRVDPARSRETGGTGLGLAIVNHVANNHHGSVSVDSVVGEGSRFCLRVPLWSIGNAPA